MCRLFGFKSIINSQVHSSLIHAENALGQQSVRHPNGWGVAYYRDQVPHIIKSAQKAFDDHIFHQVSGVVSAQTVLAHIRNATQGGHTILNSHPFQIGKWTFAHNGNIKNFEQHKPELDKLIAPEIRPYIIGETDSEMLFGILMSKIRQVHKDDLMLMADQIIKTIKHCIQDIVSIIGPLSNHEESTPKENYLTFVLTNGEMMFAHQGGQPLYLCTYKKTCPERDICPHFSDVCESPPGKDKKVNHVIFSSEPIQKQNVWNAIENGELIGVSQEMQLIFDNSDIVFN
jgi:predicted glutamine amidotransferase